MNDQRREAAIKGQPKYYGPECKVCGNTLRYTSNGNCVDCSAKHASAYNKRMRELVKKLKQKGGF